MNNQLSTTSDKTTQTPHLFHNNLINHFFNLMGFSHNKEITTFDPKIEVAENTKNIVVTAEIPGLEANDIDLEISPTGYLTISGEKRHETEKTTDGGYFSEISYGSFSRTVPLPWKLDYTKVDADYTNGVLTVAIPKIADAKAEKKQKVNIHQEAATSKTNSSKRRGRAKKQ